MDYSQLSDFEINVAVFEAIHNGSPDYKEGENGAMVFISFEGDIVNGDAVEVEVERGSFNPCANPADACRLLMITELTFSGTGTKAVCTVLLPTLFGSMSMKMFSAPP